MTLEMTKVHMSNGASNSWEGDEHSQLLADQIAVMVEKENVFYSCVDYLSELPKSNNFIDEGWRQKAAEWMFKVIDFYVSTIHLTLFDLISDRLLTSFTMGSTRGFRIWSEIS